MPDAPDDSIPPGRLRTMQVLAGALFMGLAVLLCVVVYLVHVPNGGRPLGQTGGLPMLSVVALGVLAFFAVLSSALPNRMIRQGVRRVARGGLSAGDVDRLLALRQTTLIVGLALLQGPAMFCCIAYLMEARVYVLGGAGLAILMMLSRFPTEAGLRNWLRLQLDAVERERQASPG